MMDELVQRILTNPLAEEVLSTIVITEEEEALFIQQHEVVTNVLKARRHLKKTKDEEKRKRWRDMFLRNLVIFHDIEIKMHQLGTLRQSIIQMAATSRNAPYVVKQETLLHIANLRKKFARSVMEKEDRALFFTQEKNNKKMFPKQKARSMSNHLYFLLQHTITCT